jgi:UDP-GlcNAc3NAcA epimerase
MAMAMKIVTVVGARPQFIKAAAVSRVLRREHREIIIHTGQHYDANMSDIFFEELRIPRPDYNLDVGSGPHGRQTAQMLAKIEEVLLSENPDAVLVYGDTNSTLAGALAASKLLIPVMHIEAGLRSFNMRMPEEQNRVLTDHISSRLFCPTLTAVENLSKEGIVNHVYNVGDVMCDALQFYKGVALQKYGSAGAGGLSNIIPRDTEIKEEWYVATIHRAENTDGTVNLKNILSAFDQLDAPVIFPVHPRTKRLVEELCQRSKYANIHFVEPVGYLHMIYLVSAAKKVITDSGGLQKEAYLLEVPCVTVREQTEWVESLAGDWNVLAKPDAVDITDKVCHVTAQPGARRDYYGDGHAAEKICALLREGL